MIIQLDTAGGERTAAAAREVAAASDAARLRASSDGPAVFADGRASVFVQTAQRDSEAQTDAWSAPLADGGGDGGADADTFAAAVALRGAALPAGVEEVDSLLLARVLSRRAAALPSEVEDAVAHADGLQALEALRWRERLSRAAASAAAALAAKERDLRRREAEREATSAQRLLARAELLEAAAVKRAAATAATASHTLLAERAARTHALLRASFTAGGLSATLLPLQQSPPPPLPLPPPQVVGGPLLDTLTGSKADWARVSGSAYSLLGRADLTTASAVIAACDTARHAAAALRKAAALARETDHAFAAVQAAQVRSSERAAVDKTRAAARVAVAVAVAVPEPPHFRSSEDIWASPA